MFFETDKFFHEFKCTKFSELRAIMGLMGLVHCGCGYFVGPEFFFVFCVAPNIFLVGISWV